MCSNQSVIRFLNFDLGVFVFVSIVYVYVSDKTVQLDNAFGPLAASICDNTPAVDTLNNELY